MIIFLFLFLLTILIGYLTNLIATDSISLGFSFAFLLSLFIALKWKKTIFIFWVVIIAFCATFFLVFLNTLILGEEGKTLAILVIESKNEKEMRGYIEYQNEKKYFVTKGEIIGVEAYQVLLKPWMHYLFGGKRILLTAVFSEEMNEDFTKGTTYYYAIDGSFNRREFWQNLQKKKILLFGIEGAQRVQVSIMPHEKQQRYGVRFSHQGLSLVKMP